MSPLDDLTSPESGLLLDTPDFESDWLLQPVLTWSRSDDYKKALEYVNNGKVVSDIEGRAVLLSQL